MIWVTDSSGNLLIDASGQPVPVTDNGESITVDGTVSISGSVAVTGTVGVSGTVAATQSGSWSVSVTGSVTTADSQVVTDNAAFTDGTTKLRMAGYIYDETAGTALTENDAAAARVDFKRAQVLVIEDATTRGRRAAIASDGSLYVAAQTDLPVYLTGVPTVDTELTTADLDTGAGTDTRAVVGLVLAASGGGVLVGAANPMPVYLATTPYVNAVQYGTWTVGTELPTPGDLTDSMAGPTTPAVGALLMAFNGSSWFRLRGDSTNGIFVQGTVSADTELPAAAALADGLANPTTPTLGAAELLFNGSTWDRRPGTQEGPLLASATRNTTNDSAVQTNYGAKGVLITMNLTAAAGTGIKLEIRGIDPILGGDIVLARFSANRTNTAQVHWLELHPGAASASVDGFGERFQGCLPRRWKLRVLHSDGNNLTYSVGYTLLP